jgi:hypothetical protein
MNPWDIKVLIKDIGVYIDLINQFDIPIEHDKLYQLEQKLKSGTKYHVCAKDIVINVTKSISGTNPPEIKKLAIYFSSTYECDEAKDINLYDPIKSNYLFNFQLNAYDSANKEYVNCWRLDQDIISPASKYTHPYYHFQAGGDELANKDTGDLVMFSAPRLPHPPMDLFLGLHFILSNYLSTKDYPKFKEFLTAYEYQEIIKRSQCRMWIPYFNSFTNANSNLDFTFEKVFPLFIL